MVIRHHHRWCFPPWADKHVSQTQFLGAICRSKQSRWYYRLWVSCGVSVGQEKLTHCVSQLLHLHCIAPSELGSAVWLHRHALNSLRAITVRLWVKHVLGTTSVQLGPVVIVAVTLKAIELAAKPALPPTSIGYGKCKWSSYVWNLKPPPALHQLILFLS